MRVRLSLISHAATAAVRQASFPLDEPLDPQGLEKAATAAAALRRVDAAWSSPALRARQTAAALRLDAAVDPLLRDIDLGRWAGRSFADVRAEESDAVAAWTGAADSAPHGGETIADVLERVRGWLNTLEPDVTGLGDAKSNASGRDPVRIVAVTHAAVIRAAVIVAIEANPRSFWRIDVAPLCRVMLWRSGASWTLRSIGPIRLAGA